MAFDKLRARNNGGSSTAVNFLNLILRALQFLIGIVVLIMYATQPSYHQWWNAYGYHEPKFSLGIAAGALAVATTPFLALVPFFFGYKPVAFACVWDLCVMAVYAATFAYFKNRFPYGVTGDYVKSVLHGTYKISDGRIDTMRAAVTVDLVGMILWIITLLMAIGLLLFGMVKGRRPNNF